MKEETIVRENLMNDKGYAPYCGEGGCLLGGPRTAYQKDLGQFRCGCGWVSKFPKDFINRYKQKWGL